MQDKTMKVKELLLELSEVLDRQGTYGSWIDSNTKKIYPLNKMGDHAKFIDKKFGEKYGEHLKTEEDRYRLGFLAGLVRIAHGIPKFVYVDGVADSLKKVGPIIAGTLAQPDVEEVYINKIPSTKQLSHFDQKTFHMPHDRGAALRYITS
jgi:hypothetical protein